MKINQLIIFLMAFLFIWTAHAQESVVQRIESQVQSDQVDIILCLSNQDFKEDVTFALSRAVEQIRSNYPEAYNDKGNEVCINKSMLPSDSADLSQIETVLNNKKDLSLEILKKQNQPSVDKKSKVMLTLRGAAAGMVGALVGKALKPALDQFSHKGDDRSSLSLVEGAVIGSLVDIVQRSLGETNENKIIATDAGAALVASMIKTKDPNVVGLALVLTLSQVPAVQNSVHELSKKLPAKLDWKIPVAMMGAFYLLSKNKSQEQWITSNHAPAVVSFGAAAYGIAAAEKNETTGFVIATALSVLDEVCDHVSKKCQGRFSTMDLFANTAGAYLGAKLSSYLPPGAIVQFYKKGIALSYHKKW